MYDESINPARYVIFSFGNIFIVGIRKKMNFKLEN